MTPADLPPAFDVLRDRCPRGAAILLTAPVSLLHFARFRPAATGGVGSAPWGWAPAALLARGDRVTLLCATHHRAEAQAAGGEVAVVTYEPATAAGPERAFSDALRSLVADVRGPVAAELACAPAGALRDAGELLEISELTRRLAAVKDTWEIDLIAAACRLASAGQRAVAAAARPGVTELELWDVARGAMQRLAERPVELTGDLVAGERAAHDGTGRPSARRLEEGDALVCDLVPVVDGFFGDSCSTILVGSDPPARAAAEAAAAALEAAAALLAPGTPVGEVDRAARETLARAGWTCPHYIGHGVGHSQLDFPLVDRDERALLEPGHVIALEPGVYEAPGVATRAEHVYLITADGHRRLTDHEVLVPLASE